MHKDEENLLEENTGKIKERTPISIVNGEKKRRWKGERKMRGGCSVLTLPSCATIIFSAKCTRRRSTAAGTPSHRHNSSETPSHPAAPLAGSLHTQHVVADALFGLCVLLSTLRFFPPPPFTYLFISLREFGERNPS